MVIFADMFASAPPADVPAEPEAEPAAETCVLDDALALPEAPDFAPAPEPADPDDDAVPDDAFPEPDAAAELPVPPIEIPSIAGILSAVLADDVVLHCTAPEFDSHLIIAPARTPAPTIADRLVFTARYRWPFATITIGVFDTFTETETRPLFIETLSFCGT